MDFVAARRNMVASQLRPNEVNDPAVIGAMGAVPREKFLQPSQRQFAYVDEDLPVGHGRFIMEPLVLARLLQMAEVQPTEAALVIGAAGGYSAAVLAQLASSVVGLESDPALSAAATRALAELKIDNVAVINGPLTAGCPGQAPFDVIFINGAVDHVPDAIKRQLADGGRLVTVVRQNGVGRCTLITRTEDAFGARSDYDAATPVLPGFEAKAGFVF
ncbi:MAG: protein-L-isoaspartate O-methyltransferase [Rhodospirillaceae bacterium]|nr:protein-L-isoaspartate O-methyltransferase [Rhodospirillaceae bacterium]